MDCSVQMIQTRMAVLSNVTPKPVRFCAQPSKMLLDVSQKVNAYNDQWTQNPQTANSAQLTRFVKSNANPEKCYVPTALIYEVVRMLIYAYQGVKIKMVTFAQFCAHQSATMMNTAALD